MEHGLAMTSTIHVFGPIDVRDYANRDPRGFLKEYGNGAIIDEVQRSPDLMSYLQGIVDEDPTPGRFVLTGS